MKTSIEEVKSLILSDAETFDVQPYFVNLVYKYIDIAHNIGYLDGVDKTCEVINGNAGN